MPIITAFPIPVLIKDLKPEKEVVDDMEWYVQQFYEKNKGEYSETAINITGDVCDDYLVHMQPEFAWLNEQIGAAAKEYIQACGVDTNKVNIYAQKSWPVVCEDEGYIQGHVHRSAVLSCVFYLNQPDTDSGALVFESENCMTQLPLVHDDTDLFYEDAPLLPVKHRLVLFPASLLHSVDEYYGDTPRFSISYDLVVTGSEPPGNGDYENYVLDPCFWKKI